MKISKDIKLRIIGAGKVGMSIVQAFAQKGFNVHAIDISEDNLRVGLEKIQKNIDQMIKRGKMTAEQKEDVLKRIITSTDFNDLTDADVVIEAVFEDIDLKKKIFADMDKKVSASDALLLTNTSSMCISEIAASTKRPASVAGMHFFNPVPIMKLVEIVRGVETTDETVEQILELTKLLDKIPIVSKDSPGFIVNRMLNAFVMEACRIVDEGVGSPEAVDAGAKFGLGHPMGPFELFDNLDGIPLIVHVCEYMAHELGDRFRPPIWLKNYAKAGRIGRSSGKGIYDYTEEA